eukprot:TRINITY_DN16946_c0_g1_i2.p1 TRINITY_DN16946_c0_g1~~TRINITY_DN16946_c0_g1_i2.p1  ORF type:complete len:330 (+),score=60.70 TRINITY_DN16946_c0_g1_i2:364-1353(+)
MGSAGEGWPGLAAEVRWALRRGCVVASVPEPWTLHAVQPLPVLPSSPPPALNPIVLAVAREAAACQLPAGETAARVSDAASRVGSSLHFVSVGANEGDWQKTNDPLQRHYTRPGSPWRGAAVEVLPRLLELFKARVADVETQVLPVGGAFVHGPAEGTATVWAVSEDLPRSHHVWGAHSVRQQLSTLDGDFFNLTMRRLQVPQRFWVTEQVQRINASTLWSTWLGSQACLLDSRCGALDWLGADAEKADASVLRSFLSAGMAPSVVTLEDEEAVALAAASGYVLWGGRQCTAHGDYVGIRGDLLPDSHMLPRCDAGARACDVRHKHRRR